MIIVEFRFNEPHSSASKWLKLIQRIQTGSILFCSDLFLQGGDLCPVTEEDVVEPARQTLLAYEAGPLPHTYPYASWTDDTLQMLAGLNPKLLAAMHGSSYRGDGARALLDLAAMYAATLGKAEKESWGHHT